MIHETKNPSGPQWNRLVALAEIADGMVRLATFGRYYTSLPLTVSRYQAGAAIYRLKSQHNAKGGDHG